MRLSSSLVLLLLVACSDSIAATPAPSPAPVARAAPPVADVVAVAETLPAPPLPAPVEVVQLPVPHDRPIYPVQGGTAHHRKAVMLAGLCSNPAWYLNAFANAAAEYGDFVGLQGDVDCGGASTRWSIDSPLLERRMAKAFGEAGLGALEDVTVVGYSQGAERAEWLAAYDPVRYTRFVLIGGPIVPSPRRLAHAHAVVLMAGSLDLQTLMRDGAEGLRRAGIPATFMVLPGARHGEMGPAGDDVMRHALAWLEENDKVKESTVARVTRDPAAPIAE